MNIRLRHSQKKNFQQLYPKLVSQFIHERYTVDDELALLNNYNSDPATYGDEYREYQAYRSEIKQALKTAYES